MICSAVAIVALIILIVFLLSMRLRAMGNAEELLNRIHRRQQQLLPFVAEDESTAGTDDQLWAAIGGMKGLLQLPRDASSLLSVCASLDFKDKDPAEFEINTRRVETIVLASVGTFFEVSIKKLVPWMPRPYLRLAATEYWRICLSLQTLVAAYRPNMIERVAEVL